VSEGPRDPSRVRQPAGGPVSDRSSPGTQTGSQRARTDLPDEDDDDDKAENDDDGSTQRKDDPQRHVRLILHIRPAGRHSSWKRARIRCLWDLGSADWLRECWRHKCLNTPTRHLITVATFVVWDFFAQTLNYPGI